MEVAAVAAMKEQEEEEEEQEEAGWTTGASHRNALRQPSEPPPAAFARERGAGRGPEEGKGSGSGAQPETGRGGGNGEERFVRVRSQPTPVHAGTDKETHAHANMTAADLSLKNYIGRLMSDMETSDDDTSHHAGAGNGHGVTGEEKINREDFVKAYLSRQIEVIGPDDGDVDDDLQSIVDDQRAIF